jgi:hypothetical protein
MNEEIVRWKVNEGLLSSLLEIKSNQNKPIKKGFTKCLKYIYNYKA